MGNVIVPNDAGGANALQVVVQYASAPAALSNNMTVLSAVQISFTNLDDSSSITELAQDVTIEISYNGLGLSEEQLRNLVIYNASRNEYLATSTDAIRQVAIARTRLFSTFALAVITGPVPRFYLPVLTKELWFGW